MISDLAPAESVMIQMVINVQRKKKGDWGWCRNKRGTMLSKSKFLFVVAVLSLYRPPSMVQLGGVVWQLSN